MLAGSNLDRVRTGVLDRRDEERAPAEALCLRLALQGGEDVEDGFYARATRDDREHLVPCLRVPVPKVGDDQPLLAGEVLIQVGACRAQMLDERRHAHEVSAPRVEDVADPRQEIIASRPGGG